MRAAVLSEIPGKLEIDEVQLDMVEGVLAVNQLQGDAASSARATLLEALSRTPSAPGVASLQARVAERQTQAA